MQPLFGMTQTKLEQSHIIYTQLMSPLIREIVNFPLNEIHIYYLLIIVFIITKNPLALKI